MENGNKTGAKKKKEGLRIWRKEDTYSTATCYFKYLKLLSV